MKKILMIGLVLAIAVPLLSIGQGQPSDTLGKVKARGKLVCGVNNSVPGFGFVNQQGAFSGFDIDYCKALAIAIFNNPDAVTYRPVTAAERFTALASGEIDVLIRNTTNTFQRDVQLKADFAPTTFYDGQGFLVRKASGVKKAEELKGATVCVLQGTTNEQNVADFFRARSISVTIKTFADVDPLYAAYEAGTCDSVSQDRSQLAARRTLLKAPTDHVILDNTISKEPLGPVVNQGDAPWADLVRWVVYCTTAGDEFGLNSQNVAQQIANNKDPQIRRILGLEGDFGKLLGVDNAWCANIIAKVGNYEDIYNRNLKGLGLDRGLNDSWTQGGLIYTPPFR
ncbi:amino acid ABC transporter substrate-binding protein [Candidatus Acetothermia bacterium]|nr:amino acid ABC transporter substrate-binding protein [Candidatus Acetothermia bacterium]